MERSLLRFLKSRKKPSNGMSELTLRSPYGPFRRLESPLAFRAQKPLVSLLDAFGVILIGNRSMVRAVIGTVPSKCPEGPDHHPRNPHYSWGLPAFLVPINLSLKLNLNRKGSALPPCPIAPFALGNRLRPRAAGSSLSNGLHAGSKRNSGRASHASD